MQQCLQTKRVLRIRIALRRGFLKPRPRLRRIMGDTPPLRIQPTETPLRRGKTLRGGFFIKGARLRQITRTAVARFKCQGEIVLPCCIILRCRFGKPFPCLCRIGCQTTRTILILVIETTQKILRRDITGMGKLRQILARKLALPGAKFTITGNIKPIKHLHLAPMCRHMPHSFRAIQHPFRAILADNFPIHIHQSQQITGIGITTFCQRIHLRKRCQTIARLMRGKCLLPG